MGALEPLKHRSVTIASIGTQTAARLMAVISGAVIMVLGVPAKPGPVIYLGFFTLAAINVAALRRRVRSRHRRPALPWNTMIQVEGLFTTAAAAAAAVFSGAVLGISAVVFHWENPLSIAGVSALSYLLAAIAMPAGERIIELETDAAEISGIAVGRAPLADR